MRRSECFKSLDWIAESDRLMFKLETNPRHRDLSLTSTALFVCQISNRCTSTSIVRMPMVWLSKFGIVDSERGFLVVVLSFLFDPNLIFIINSAIILASNLPNCAPVLEIIRFSCCWFSKGFNIRMISARSSEASSPAIWRVLFLENRCGVGDDFWRSWMMLPAVVASVASTANDQSW